MKFWIVSQLTEFLFNFFVDRDSCELLQASLSSLLNIVSVSFLQEENVKKKVKLFLCFGHEVFLTNLSSLFLCKIKAQLWLFIHVNISSSKPMSDFDLILCLQFMPYINPLKRKLFQLIFKTSFSLYLKENTTPHHYKRQSVNTVQGNNLCLQSESCRTKYRVNWMLKQLMHIVTTWF
jgi:hypothetical protein